MEPRRPLRYLEPTFELSPEGWSDDEPELVAQGRAPLQNFTHFSRSLRRPRSKTRMSQDAKEREDGYTIQHPDSGSLNRPHISRQGSSYRPTGQLVRNPPLVLRPNTNGPKSQEPPRRVYPDYPPPNQQPRYPPPRNPFAPHPPAHQPYGPPPPPPAARPIPAYPASHPYYGPPWPASPGDQYQAPPELQPLPPPPGYASGPYRPESVRQRRPRRVFTETAAAPPEEDVVSQLQQDLENSRREKKELKKRNKLLEAKMELEMEEKTQAQERRRIKHTRGQPSTQSTYLQLEQQREENRRLKLITERICNKLDTKVENQVYGGAGEVPKYSLDDVMKLVALTREVDTGGIKEPRLDGTNELLLALIRMANNPTRPTGDYAGLSQQRLGFMPRNLIEDHGVGSRGSIRDVIKEEIQLLLRDEDTLETYQPRLSIKEGGRPPPAGYRDSNGHFYPTNEYLYPPNGMYDIPQSPGTQWSSKTKSTKSTNPTSVSSHGPRIPRQGRSPKPQTGGGGAISRDTEPEEGYPPMAYTPRSTPYHHNTLYYDKNGETVIRPTQTPREGPATRYREEGRQHMAYEGNGDDDGELSSSDDESEDDGIYERV